MSQNGKCDCHNHSDGGRPGGMSRRDFIKSVICVGAVSVTGGILGGYKSSEAASLGIVTERLITLNVNGQKRRVDVLPNETLAQTLRNKLGLMGLKIGCDRAECGACTVLINDVPEYSCSILTHSVSSSSISTIEGLAETDGTLHPLQQGVVDEQGFQCGFCAPGFIMSSLGYLKTNPEPTRDELAHGVSGNICRCQDYEKILNALMRGAEYMRKE